MLSNRHHALNSDFINERFGLLTDSLAISCTLSSHA